MSKDIPPYAVAVGVPIKVIKYRFTKEQIQALQQIQWRNWNEEQLQNVEEYFEDVDEFIRISGKI